jgi:AraC family transcriptional regulator
LEYDFSGGVLLLSSEGPAWGALAARYYHSPANYQASVPAFDLDALVIQIRGATPLTSKIARTLKSVRSEPGDIYLVPKGEATEWAAGEPCELLHLYATPALLSAVALQTADIDPRRIELKPRVQLRDPLIHQIGLAMLSELRSAGPLGRLYIESLTQLLVVHLLRAHTTARVGAPEPVGGLSPISLRYVLEYIGAHLSHELSLESLAELTGLSAYHFARLFTQSVGLSPHRYVVRRRLEEAKRLLLNGTHTIAEVATLTGFADQSHLHRLFKQRFGITPGSLLKRPDSPQGHHDG